MVRVVFDTNILISALLGRGPPTEALMIALKGKVHLVTSMELFSEFLEVMRRNKFGIPRNVQSRFATVIYILSDFVESLERVDIITIDEADNRILEAALEGKVNYIVSGDKHLRKLKEYKGIKILSAREFINKVDKDHQ
ncbi:MAG: hypothetical protein AMK69_24020 [Nitrospira bacterium SG8_3]|nr:MAG: hypothetical protein AMK69_24020 [Nitrospira bacterium SG8_3]